MTLLLIGLACVAALFVIAALKPDTFRYERRLSMRAPAAAVFPHLADFDAWRAWSPWEHLDPAMQRRFSGPTAAPGAVYEWEGNKKVGKGRMEILAAQAPHNLRIQLDFFSPWEAHNLTEFRLEEVGSETTVIWSMSGPQPYMSKFMGLFMNFERMIGRDFDAGLVALRGVVEQGETYGQGDQGAAGKA